MQLKEGLQAEVMEVTEGLAMVHDNGGAAGPQLSFFKCFSYGNIKKEPGYSFRFLFLFFILKAPVLF